MELFNVKEKTEHKDQYLCFAENLLGHKHNSMVIQPNAKLSIPLGIQTRFKIEINPQTSTSSAEQRW